MQFRFHPFADYIVADFPKFRGASPGSPSNDSAKKSSSDPVTETDQFPENFKPEGFPTESYRRSPRKDTFEKFPGSGGLEEVSPNHSDSQDESDEPSSSFRPIPDTFNEFIPHRKRSVSIKCAQICYNIEFSP